MASSAVSSVLYLRDAAGNHAETRSGANIYDGDAASFHEWEFRTRLRIGGKTGDQYIEAMSKVCDGLRGEAFVAAQEVGFDNLCEIVDETPRGIDTLISHMRGVVFSLTEHESKELFRQYCRPRGPLSRQNEESMKQYVSRRRHYWTLLVEMDLVIHLSEGHRSDMLLDLIGLTRDERVMVQASINNERDFTELPKPSSIKNPRIHLREKSETCEGKSQRRVKNVETIQTLVGFAEKARANTPTAENLEQVPITRTTRQLKISIRMTTRLNPQMATKQTSIQLTLELTTEKKFLTMMTMGKMIRFLRMLLWMMSLFWRQLNWMQLLFLPTRGTMILILK